jgi:hypothetical protein
MYLTSLTHREQLFELATRWFGDRPNPGDGRFLTQASLYENVITAPVVIQLLVDLQQVVPRRPMRLVRFRTKDQLRDAILQSCVDPSAREAELFSRFRQFPEEFFPGTPGDMVVGLGEDGSILGMARAKRPKRIAEKCSRRVTHHLEGSVLHQARANASSRAAERGVPIQQLISSDDEMAEDFYAAERTVAQSFREGSLRLKPEDLRIDDVIGVKLVCPAEEMDRIEQTIRNHPFVVGVVREVHQGLYNDINLVVEMEIPSAEEIIVRERDRDWSSSPRRGISPEQLAVGFPDYVASGARTFFAEVILTTRQDLVESEFGSSIHESRILEQRKGLRIGGRIACNASFLIEYMLMLPLSPVVDIRELPVKMWGRYLPDAYSIAIWELFGLSISQEQIESLSARHDMEPKHECPD